MDSTATLLLFLCCSVISELGEARARTLEEDCVWNRDKDFPKFPSVLIDSETWRLVLPTMDKSKTKIIRISGGSTVVVACPGGKILAFPTKEAISGYCAGGNLLRVDNTDPPTKKSKHPKKNPRTKPKCIKRKEKKRHKDAKMIKEARANKATNKRTLSSVPVEGGFHKSRRLRNEARQTRLMCERRKITHKLTSVTSDETSVTSATSAKELKQRNKSNVSGTKHKSNYDMKELGCTKRVQESISKNIYSKDPCSSGSSKTAFHSIGYSIPGYQFYELIRVCFDHDLETAVVTSHLLQGESVTAKDENPTRPSFKLDEGFFSVDTNNCYDQDSQSKLMADLLGNSSVINIKRSQYFARGHMSPDSDFLTELTADATYHYINAVPQWQSVNNGNWKALEIAVRKLASKNGGRDFQIWTGPLGILKLGDTTGKAQKIYLGLVEQKKVIPVPEITWKVIYEKSTNRGIAVIGLNNPFLTQFTKMLCPDICDQIPWIKFDVTKFNKGGIYCCDVQSFRRAVPSLPNLGRVQLLDG